ncbi:unnamed protein product [Lepeophtheirus salmonis]|uniref:(salmon louse) hypothetical protein n=1 Tax=Lepeophtheirus salmonis TaxID=72036 RepID=A0A7R8D517_LEPSM|nr:unnamed protein product [Lepeophtheirus salmonis]CAF2976248.1 unnamed protein product [Lepeophtheirus salmonis]
MGSCSQNQDLASIRKGIKLCSSVMAMIFFNPDDEKRFFTGIVGTEMKSVFHNIKLIVATSKEVLSSNWEYAGGIGDHPMCKDIVSALIVLEDFISNGTVNMLESCTEQLQLFKSKISSWGTYLNRRNRTHVDGYPNPKGFRNRKAYSDELRIKTINCSYCSGVDISWRYTFGSADLQSAVPVHDYLIQSFTHF